jgi:hypothetical protein
MMFTAVVSETLRGQEMNAFAWSGGPGLLPYGRGSDSIVGILHMWGNFAHLRLLRSAPPLFRQITSITYLLIP